MLKHSIPWIRCAFGNIPYISFYIYAFGIFAIGALTDELEVLARNVQLVTQARYNWEFKFLVSESLMSFPPGHTMKTVSAV